MNQIPIIINNEMKKKQQLLQTIHTYSFYTIHFLIHYITHLEFRITLRRVMTQF